MIGECGEYVCGETTIAAKCAILQNEDRRPTTKDRERWQQQQ